jgi:nucleoside-diphosphate kinase
LPNKISYDNIFIINKSKEKLMKERSYVMVKPEFANYPEVIKEVLNQLLTEQGKGLSLIKGDYVTYTTETARKHYAEHVGKDFYPGLEAYITSDKAYGMIIEGEDAIAQIRAIVGSTKNPAEGTIRHEIPRLLGLEERVTQNVVHASDSVASAEREIAIFEEMLAELDKSL